MYPKTKYQQKIIGGRKNLRLNRVIVRGFAICLFCWFSIGIYNYGLAQTEDKNSKDNSKNNKISKKHVRKPNPEARFNRIFVMENMAPLPFKTFPSKPVNYDNLTVDEEKIDSIRLESKKIQGLAKSQPVSTFVLDEQKQKEREKHLQEMKQFNHKRNQKLHAIFKNFQKIRYQPVIYSGKHYDYTRYNQYFQAAPSR